VVRPPKRSTVAATIRPQAVSSVTSAPSPNASPPAALIARAVSSAAAAARSTHATRAPSAAKRIAVARPMPEPAPVISASAPRIRVIRIPSLGS